MYGRSERGYRRRGRGGGSGYDYGRDSYPEPWMSPYDRPNRGSYRPKRGRYDYSEPERGGYRGRRKQHRPPHHASPRGRGDPRGGFRGNFRPSRPVRGARTPNHPPFPQRDQFQQLKPFVDNFYFGGGFKLKAKRWKGKWNQRFEGGRQPPEMKTSAENSKSEEPGAEEGGNPEGADQSTMSDGEQEVGTQEETGGNPEGADQTTMSDGEQEAGTQEETEHTEQTQSSYLKRQDDMNELMDVVVSNKIQFSCALCKFRTFYEDEWNNHLKTNLHSRHFRYVEKKLSSKEAGFLEAYVEANYKRAKDQRKRIEDLNAKILEIHQKQDLTLGLGMENFVKKVEVIHCGACDVFLPMHSFILRQHIKTPIHRINSKSKILVSKQQAFTCAMSILGNKRNRHSLEQYLNGENPFRYNDEENITSGCSGDLAPEGEDGEMACITLSDSEGDDDDDFQGQNSFINDEEEEEEDIRSHCSTEVVPETEESEQMPCSTPPDTERDDEEEEEEDYCDGQVTEQETA